MSKSLKATKILAIFVCTLQGKLFFAVILGSVFSDFDVFCGDIINAAVYTGCKVRDVFFVVTHNGNSIGLNTKKNLEVDNYVGGGVEPYRRRFNNVTT